METSKVGFRFCPTDVELINYYLKNKIQRKLWLVDDTIREVKICSYEPASLPALSMIKSKDLEWYFSSPKEYTSPKKNVRKRATPSGFWKPTGKDRNVKEDKRRNSAVIGIKKTLVYYEGKSSNAVRTPWTMHEYHITCLPLLNKRTYVLCKIFYKGNVEDIPSGSNSTKPCDSLANKPPLFEQAGEESLSGFSVNDGTMLMEKQEDLCPWDALYPNPNTLFITNNDNPNVHLQAPCLAQDYDELFIDNKDNAYEQLQGPCLGQDDIEFLGGMTHVNREHVEFLFIDDQEFITQENSEEYMLQWSLLI